MIMNSRKSAVWFRAVTIILILFGLLFVFFGLRIFSDNVPLIPRDVLLPWESALYGAIMLGWGVTLLLVGRAAFRRDDRKLKRALLVGLAVWLAVEAAASAWFGMVQRRRGCCRSRPVWHPFTEQRDVGKQPRPGRIMHRSQYPRRGRQSSAVGRVVRTEIIRG
jgi:hypothetical protein